jgi:hypothetical protein
MLVIHGTDLGNLAKRLQIWIEMYSLLCTCIQILLLNAVLTTTNTCTAVTAWSE